MSSRARISSILAIATAAHLCPAGPLRAQIVVEKPPAPTSAAPAIPAPAAEPESGPVLAIRTQLEALETNSALDEKSKAALKQKLESAIALFKQAQSDDALAAGYREALAEDSEEKLTAVRAELAQISNADDTPGPPPGMDPDASTEAIKDALNRQRAAVATLKESLADLDQQLAVEQTRPEQWLDEITSADAELADTERRLGNLAPETPESPIDEKVERALLEAGSAAAKSEIEKLQQEELSYDRRIELLRARRELTQAKVALAEDRLLALGSLANRRLAEDVSEVARTAARAQAESADKHPAIQKVAQDIASLSDEFQKIAGTVETIEDEQNRAQRSLDQLTQTAQNIQQQIELGGLRGGLAQVLVDQRRRLPDSRQYRRKLANRKSQLAELRLGAFVVDNQLRAFVSTDREITAIMQDEVAPALPEAQRLQIKGELASLVAQRTELRAKLSDEYQQLIRNVGQLEFTERLYLDKVEAFDKFLNEKLFWVPGIPPLGLDTFRELPQAVRWIFKAENFQELGRALSELGQRAPLWTAGLMVALLALIALRRRLKRVIDQCAAKVRRVSNDRYFYTARALAGTILLAAPIPLLVWYVGWNLQSAPSGSDWLMGVGQGLQWSASLLFALFFADVGCREKGIAQAHFHWDPPLVDRFRRTLWLILPAYILAGFVVWVVLADSTAEYVDSLGRLTFIALMPWFAFHLSRMVRPGDGIFSWFLAENPKSWLARLQVLWRPLFWLTPLFLAALAALGHLIAALKLNYNFSLTLLLLAATAVVYALILRWFTIRERKLKLEQRLEERRRAQEKAAQDQEPGDAGSEEEGMPEIEEAELDLAQVGEQTRDLLRFLCGVGFAIGVWFIWKEVVPALQSLDAKMVAGGISVFDLIAGTLIVMLTWVGAKNIPGLLEVAVLQFLPIDAGARYATTTIARYAIVTIGSLSFFHTLGLEWSKFGWIAAALSVGLGFGLQEIVANFISGLILLFERPIRIGDIVTVSGTTGVVSRIRTRATTITNWDRQEFIVPNKEFITGTILNWTLSNPINRITISVGVAYGSDTEKARELLLEAAREHPRILEEPVPLATFEQFADSALNLQLRAFLPDIDNRLATITDLHTAIDRKFKAAGIEIAFPQMDLHVRSVDPDVRFPG